MEDLNELKQKVSLLDYIKQSAIGKIERVGSNEYRLNPCPVCGSKDHFTIYADSNSYSSFNGCCKGGTIIDYFIEIEHLSTEEAIKKLYQITGTEYKTKTRQKGDKNVTKTGQKNEVEKVQEKEKNDNLTREELEKTITFIQEGIKQKNIDNVMQVVSKRGISKEIANKYNMFVANLGKEARLFIPIFENGKPKAYIGRAIDPTNPVRYRNSKGEIIPFNREYITKENDKNESIYICEGIFDSLSIEESQKKSIALNSTSQVNRFIEYMQKHIKTASSYNYILCFDNDEAGEKATNEMKTALEEMKISYKVLQIPKEYKDINEWFVSFNGDLEAFKQELNPYHKETILNYINNSFLNDISKMNNYKGRSTGFIELDKKINGVYPGLYVLGAISSLGKTTYIHQLADQMASKGEKIIFFSLEQSKFELVAKGVSRQTFLINPREAKTSLAIMQNTDIADITIEAVRNYQEIADNTIIVEGNFDMTVKTVRNYVESYIKTTGNKPIVILDYLQILRPMNDRLTEKQQVDFNVSELKRISRDNDIPIFIICSFNRENYTTTVDFTSFKESGAIEYGADVVMGLQLKVMDEFTEKEGLKSKRDKINMAKAQMPREVNLIGLKNRNGKSYFKCLYKYYPAFNYFEEIPTLEED